MVAEDAADSYEPVAKRLANRTGKSLVVSDLPHEPPYESVCLSFSSEYRYTFRKVDEFSARPPSCLHVIVLLVDLDGASRSC